MSHESTLDFGGSVRHAELLAQLLEASLDGVFSFDRAYRITHWNAAMARMLGARREDVIGRVVFDVFPFYRAIGEVARFEEALAGRSSTSREGRFDVPERGLRGAFEAHYGPVVDAHGNVIGGHAVVRDVTAHKHAEEQLRETEGRFRTMADRAPVLLWMAGTNGECDFFNQVWLEFTGRTMEQEIGIGWTEGLHPYDFQLCVDTFTDAFNQRAPFKMVYRLRRHDGVYRSILDNGVPRYTPNGTFSGFIGSCIDITDRVEDDAHRRLLVDQLTHALEARDEFISIASHELRTPLTSLKLHIQRLLRWVAPSNAQPIDNERLERLAHASHKQMLRFERLIDAMLTGTRLAHEVIMIEPREVDLCELAREAIERFEVVAESAGIRVSLLAEAPVLGYWDPACVDQILVNLLMNAVKYGDAQPITVEVRGDEQNAVLTVHDHGRGIAEGDQERIFERFERAVPYAEVSGLGLGLFIVKQLTKAHGGLVHVDSREGHGSIFVVELPRRGAPVGRTDLPLD